MRQLIFLVLLGAPLAGQVEAGRMEADARAFLIDLIKLDTTNPPGNETRVAEYLAKVCRAEGIEVELLGPEAHRKSFVARLKGSGTKRPLLLMAHSDVVPADPKLWTVPPFSAQIREGYVYGRGASDDKSLLAAELAVFLDLKRKKVKLTRDVILLSEADEEAGSTAINWLIANVYPKIEAEFAINEGGGAMAVGDQTVYQIQTSEKIPTRVTLSAKGTAGHGSLPRADNPVVHLAEAILKLARAEQPVRLNTTTRRYFSELAKLPQYSWVAPYVEKLESAEATDAIALRDAELNAMLRTSVSPTMLNAGMKNNVIPNLAESTVDVRRLPNESKQEVIERFKRIINDPAVEVLPTVGQDMPATEPSSLTTDLYLAMEKIFGAQDGARVIPFMSRGATDGSYLRQKGMAVYGIPIFKRDGTESRAHGNDERMQLDNLSRGTALLRRIVVEVAEAR